jgi:hypothetical protein
MPCRSFFFAVAFSALLLQGCSAVRPKPPEHLIKSAGASATIYVVRRAWHIDIGFASSDLPPPLSALATGFPGVHYLLFGFGDRRYLQSKNKQLPNMLGALWPGAGLILMTALATTPAQAFGAGNLIALPVSAEQMRAAQASVWASIATRATQDYSALHTCNTWAAEVLRAAGLPIRSSDVVFAGQLWKQTRRLAAPRRVSLAE